MAAHCKDCEDGACGPLLQNCEVLFRSRDQRTKEIMEAVNIQTAHEKCIRVPSLHFSAKEIEFL